ncbi:MAG: mechanosensitive ion channel domain-containing protein [Chloroflexota bacterium]|nr:mechanosensitive ion channel domain-containing protein [Chloroflexota bacterium]
MEILSIEWFGNSLRNYLIALIIVIASVTIMRVLRNIILARLRPVADITNTKLDDLAANLVQSTRSWFIFGISFFIGIKSLQLPQTANEGFRIFMLFISLLQTATWSNQLINHILHQYTQNAVEDEGNRKNTVAILGLASRIILWAILLLLALDNLGIEITGLITGLGIGGIAIALAIQNILSDLLAYVSIMMDRPFAIGDFIVVDEFTGVVERIGLKTTRLRSLSGELLIFSNNDLLSSRMRNYKDREQRRVLFSIGVTYDTPADSLASIPGIIRDILETQEHVQFDRAHLKSFGSFSIDFEIVYYVTTADYLIYMDVQQNINLEIVRAFEKSGIEFAFPTQTVFLNTNSS